MTQTSESMRAAQLPLRLFLDAGVLIDGYFNRWGSCKAVLIMATLRARFRAVIAEPIRAEVDRNVVRKTNELSAEERRIVDDGIEGWFRLARPERLPWPSEAEMLAHRNVLAAVRHRNDMPGVIAAVLARPDWVLSTNTEHWNQALAARTGLQIATPTAFLASLQPT